MWSGLHDMKKVAILTIGLALFALLSLSSCRPSAPPPLEGASSTIMTVNGEPIIEAEYELARNLSVMNGMEHDGRSKESVVIAKLIQLEGVKYGLLPSASYASFQERFHKENEHRAEAIKHKQVIYGPQQYTEDKYYADELSRLIIRLKELIYEKTMDLSEAVLKQQYEDWKQDYAEQATIVLKEIVEPMGADSEAALRRIKASYAKLQSGNDFLVLYDSRKAHSAKAMQETVSEYNKRDFLKYRENFFNEANRLKAGQMSKIFADRDRYVVVYCESRTEKGFKAFSEVRDEVYVRVIDRQFTAYVKSLRESANVQETIHYQ